jgi:tetratricopeptide (TPR) repeat protein
MSRFEATSGKSSLAEIASHAESCAGCQEKLARFFHAVELPESSFLRETVDELALALLNLARALIRDAPGTEETENVRITEEGGGTAAENRLAGEELIADAEDFTGSRHVGEVDLEDLRAELAATEERRTRRTDLARALFRRITTLACRSRAKAWNWLGVLHYQREEFAEAEAAFLAALADVDGARDARAFAHCNLAYVFKHRGNLDAAVKSADKALVLAEEDGRDPYFAAFAGVYLRLSRGAPADLERASGLLDEILRTPGGRLRYLQDLGLPSNAPVKNIVSKSSLGKCLGLGD